MLFRKKFSFKVTIRVIVMLCTMLLLVLIFGNNQLFFNQIILGILLIIEVAELIYFVNYTNRSLAKFILAIKHEDFSIHFKNSKLGESFDELHDAIDNIIESYHLNKLEKQAHNHLLNLVINHINLGIITIEDDEIALINDTAIRFLNAKGVKSWRILSEKNPMFTHAIEEIDESGKRLLTIESGKNKQLITMEVVAMKMLDKDIKLITFMDIHGQVEQVEIEAWHKLIRILTHEIMNSATPISSLTETMIALLAPKGVAKEKEALTDTDIQDLIFSLKTIQKRSEGMLTFIDDYRKLTKVAKPKLKYVAMETFLLGFQQLMSSELSQNHIKLNLDIEKDQVLMDASLIEQVLINLIKNSISALCYSKNPVIHIKFYVEGTRKIIELTDNGKGITEKEMKEIFVPFFSTKKDGSGIGLSLSKQIMHLHHGSIKVHSTPGEYTTFLLSFPE